MKWVNKQLSNKYYQTGYQNTHYEIDTPPDEEKIIELIKEKGIIKGNYLDNRSLDKGVHI